MKTLFLLPLLLLFASSAHAEIFTSGVPSNVFDPLPPADLIFLIQDQAGHPIVGSQVCVTPEGGSKECRSSDGNGFVGFGEYNIGWYELEITAQGYNGELMAYLLYESTPMVIHLTPGVYVPAPVCYPNEYACERALGIECDPDPEHSGCYMGRPPENGIWELPFVGDGYLYSNYACRFSGAFQYTGISPVTGSVACADVCASVGADCCEWDSSQNICTPAFGEGAYLIPYSGLRSNVRPFSAPPTPTPVPPPDTTAPVISEVSVTYLSPTSVEIIWVTNERADTRLTYGTTPARTIAAPINSTREFFHSVVITGVTPNTLYYFLPKGRDAAQNVGFGPSMTFRTKSSVCNLCQ